MDKENFYYIDLGEDEFSEYSDNDYWACGICNKGFKKIFPKPDK